MATQKTKLILASASPRRRVLLGDAGYQFEVVVPEVNEAVGLCSNCGPAELVTDLAQRKAANVAKRLLPRDDTCIVIGCDTVVECDGQILGKPTCEQHARQMLETLAGSLHRVYSGLCLWSLPRGAPQTRVAVTSLRMDRLDEHQLSEYLESHAWEGKAGEFGYQDGLGWIHIVEGSESNVVGLPLELLKEMLEASDKPNLD